ncbi:DUF1456 family protein [Sporosarcina sp. P33]|uniref:DUF1456 family protein n=1 Tax=Sporosarcina sp. P33 TaxID=1930764 RepID=UPI0009C16D17|nr:DUF1456 family protein [Sporosarcina sp. P33]ARD48358.1 cytoplasmic protein [Sporosarcina sp. P33]
MNNNDVLSRLRYALDLKDSAMAEIFALGGMELKKAEVKEMLTKTNDDSTDEMQMNEYAKEIDNITLESFLNGLISLKRGVRENTEHAPQPFLMSEEGHRNVNNILLKKVKIALSLTSEDMLQILGDAGVIISKNELSAVLRKEGHRNYKPCGDRYARNFLKGLAMRYRNQ